MLSGYRAARPNEPAPDFIRDCRSQERLARGNQIAWNSDAPASKDKYLAVFNLADQDAAEIRVDWKDLNLAGTVRVRDLWEHADVGGFADSHTFHLPPHGAGLYKLTK